MAWVKRALGVARKLLWLIVLLGLGGAVGYLRFWAPVHVNVALADRGAVVEEAFGRGTVESEREAAVGFDDRFQY